MATNMSFASFKSMSAGFLLLVSSSVFAADIQGAGATFPALLYQKWATHYSARRDLKVDYLAVGSGEGIKRIIAREVDFGGSDMPLKVDELNKNGLLQFPMVMGAITPVFNIPGVYIAQLRLDSKTLAAIFMGKIRKWNAPEIIVLNPALHLPDLPIRVIYREDKSGTTFNFTNYLSKVSAEWKSSIGEGLIVKWPVGLAAKGNSGVAIKVKETPGAIGYADYAHAMEQNLDYAKLKNRDGYFVSPNAASTQAASAGAKWDADNGFYQILTDAQGEKSWPIVATTFILVRKDFENIERRKNTLKFLNWSYRIGELDAISLDFVMLPKPVMDKVRLSWRDIQDGTVRLASN